MIVLIAIVIAIAIVIVIVIVIIESDTWDIYYYNTITIIGNCIIM